MRYEVEQKFPVSSLADVEGHLTALGAAISTPKVEVDVYYNHPARDFAVTDEAVRIRTVGPSSCITYKGPKIDATTKNLSQNHHSHVERPSDSEPPAGSRTGFKTRREIELPLAADTAAGWAELLVALGFRSVAEVRKRRRKAYVPWQAQRVEVSLDEVEGLGCFVELELVVEEPLLETAKACLAALAQRMGLKQSERRSYLELLLGSRR